MASHAKHIGAFGTSGYRMADLHPERLSGHRENRLSDVPNEPAFIPALPDAMYDGTVDRCELATHEGSPAHTADFVDLGVEQHVPSVHSDDVPKSPGNAFEMVNDSNKDQGSSSPQYIHEPSRSISTTHRKEETFYLDPGGGEPYIMHRFSLYETASRYYLIGGDITDSWFKVLKIDRTVEESVLSIAEDEMIYTKTEMNQLLNTVDDGNKSTGGLKLKCSPWGLLGFIRFTGPYYMLLITKRSQVAILGGHYIYQIDGTELVPLATSSSTRLKVDRHPEEARFMGVLSSLDLSRSFYFSYSYNITRTLQHNIVRQRRNLQQDHQQPARHDVNEMFVWNHHLLKPAMDTMRNSYDWCQPIIHGFIDQAGECYSMHLGIF